MSGPVKRADGTVSIPSKFFGQAPASILGTVTPAPSQSTPSSANSRQPTQPKKAYIPQALLERLAKEREKAMSLRKSLEMPRLSARASTFKPEQPFTPPTKSSAGSPRSNSATSSGRVAQVSVPTGKPSPQRAATMIVPTDTSGSPGRKTPVISRSQTMPAAVVTTPPRAAPTGVSATMPSQTIVRPSSAVSTARSSGSPGVQSGAATSVSRGAEVSAHPKGPALTPAMKPFVLYIGKPDIGESQDPSTLKGTVFHPNFHWLADGETTVCFKYKANKVYGKTRPAERFYAKLNSHKWTARNGWTAQASYKAAGGDLTKLKVYRWQSRPGGDWLMSLMPEDVW